MDLKNKKIGVLMGGFSSEREISLRSGKNVHEVLKNGGYRVTAIDVNKNFLEVLNKEEIEVAFNVLHGEFGEDGRVQAILEFLGIPYTGSGLEASNISMNKILSKQMASLAGVSTPAFLKIQSKADLETVPFGFPWVVKPIKEGSSIGVQIIKSSEEKNSFTFDNKSYFVEQFVEGIEVTVGVLDNGIEQLILPVLQIVPKKEFYDFEAKYTKGMTDFILPAQLPKKIYQKVQEAALLVHQTIGCRGATRSDFIIQEGKPYFLEINTNPGMTETSDIPAQARAYGMSDLELCEKILESAGVKEK